MTKAAIQVADMSVEPGSLALGSMLAGYDNDSSEVRVPTIVINGGQPGPTLFLGALVHGDELVGIEVLRRVMREHVDPGRLNGSIIAIPIQNPLAYRSSSYHSLEDGLNANRIHPGDRHETLTNRIVAVANDYCVEQSDYVIDLHSNSRDSIYFNFTRWQDSEVGRANVAMSRAFGFTTVLSEPKSVGFGFEERLVGLLADTALKAEKPCITVELTPTHNWETRSIDAGVIGTLNVLRHLEMLEGEIEVQSADLPIIQETLGPQLRVTPEKGGIVHPVVPVGTWVEHGEVLVWIRDPWGDVVEEVASPAAGYVLSYPHHGNHTAASGDIVVFVAPISSVEV